MIIAAIGCKQLTELRAIGERCRNQAILGTMDGEKLSAHLADTDQRILYLYETG